MKNAKNLVPLILGYIYNPLIYFAVYYPFIVPRLSQWRQIPYWIVSLELLGFIAIMMIIGTKRSHALIILHSFGIAVFLGVYSSLMSKFQMPGFLKIEGGLLWSMLEILISAIITMAFAEIGYFFEKIKKQKTSIAN